MAGPPVELVNVVVKPQGSAKNEFSFDIPVPESRQSIRPQVPADEVRPTHNHFDDALTIYPNPALDDVTLSLNAMGGSGEASIQVYDHMGRMVMSQSVEVYDHSLWRLNVSDLRAGAYFVQVNTDQRQYVKRLIIQER